MPATLYVPGQPPLRLPTGQFLLLDSASDHSDDTQKAALALDCVPQLVDVLATGPDYIAFSVFDHQGATNPAAMRELSALTGVAFDATNEDEVLRGPVLVVSR